MTNDCPNCGNPLTIPGHELASWEVTQPREGDGGVCSHCAAILVFTSPTTVRLATQAEGEAMDDQVRILAYQEAIMAGKIRPLSERGKPWP